MHSHSVGSDMPLFACVQTGEALVRLPRCSGLPESSLFFYVMSTIFT